MNHSCTDRVGLRTFQKTCLSGPSRPETDPNDSPTADPDLEAVELSQSSLFLAGATSGPQTATGSAWVLLPQREARHAVAVVVTAQRRGRAAGALAAWPTGGGGGASAPPTLGSIQTSFLIRVWTLRFNHGCQGQQMLRRHLN